jgi:hypothetical protein
MHGRGPIVPGFYIATSPYRHPIFANSEKRTFAGIRCFASLLSF